MLSLFKSKPLVDNNTLEWALTTYQWALKTFDAKEFFIRTKLVLPSNDFFPGRVTSVEEKAQNIFKHTLAHAGLSHWPFELRSIAEAQNDSQCQVPPAPQADLQKVSRNSEDNSQALINNEQPLFVFYNPQQTLKPEDMAASFAHVIAQHLILQSQQLPPGGMDYFSEAAELLASMMGFGVLLTNSAFTYRGGCGSCYNPMANRQPALTEIDNIFVLAMFCHLKHIPNKDVLQHLKKHLHSNYKQAAKQIESMAKNHHSLNLDSLKRIENESH